MTKLLEQAFQIRPTERRIVLLFFAFFVGVGMFYTIGATVGDTLFLSNLPKAEVPRMLPFVYLGVAVANVIATLTFDAVQSRASRTSAIIGTQIALAATVLCARQIVGAHVGPVYLGLVIWLEVCSLLSITLFFSFAGDYFSPPDARRLYGFIAGGMSLGTIVAGYAIRVSVGFVGTQNLLYAACVVLLANASLSALIYRVGKPVSLDAVYQEESVERLPLRALFARPYVRLLALMISLAIVSYVTVDYQMKWIASRKSEEALARFFGSFFGWVGIAQISFQFGIAQRLLRRLGIINSLTILPLAIGTASLLLYAGSFFGYFGVGLLLLSAGVNFLRMTLSETLDLPSRELLFLPLPTRLRRRVQPLTSGALAPAAQGLGALLMLGALRLHLPIEALSLVAAGCAASLVLTLVRLRPEYRETLAATLRDHQLDATDLEQILQNPAAEGLIESLLRASDGEVVKATIGLLSGRKLGALLPILEQLVDADDSEVAVAALERLSAEKHEGLMGSISRGWSSPHLAVRQAAVLALCEASGQSAVDQLSEALGSTDPALRSSAIVGLGRFCGEAGQSLVRPGLLEQAKSSDPTQRAEAAHVLGRIRSPGFADIVTALLSDPVLEVRRAAADASAEIGDPLLIPPLLRAVAEADLRALSVRALSAMPENAIASIAQALATGTASLSERCALAGVLGAVGGLAAAEALWAEVGPTHELPLRLAAAEALRAMRARDALPRIELADYDEQVEAICSSLHMLDRAVLELGSRRGIASGIFRDHARSEIELLCAVLAVRHDLRAIDRVQYNLFNEQPEVRERALELAEEVLPRRLSQPVVTALQAWSRDQRRAGGGDGLTAATQQQLIASEPWLRVATVHHLNQGAAYPTIEAGSLNEQDRELYRLLDVVSFLERVPLLSELSAHHLLEQAEVAQWRMLAAGDSLFQQGDHGEALYIICQGELEVRLAERVIARLGAGECIGELALLDGEPRSAGAVAATDTTLLEIAAARFKHLLLTQPTAAHALLRTLDKRIRETQASGQPSPAAAGPPMRRSQLMRAQKLGLQQLVSTMSFLRKVDLFEDLSTSALANLAGIAQEVIVYPGDTLFEEGDAGESMYLLCSGKIAISAGERRLAVLERGACLGEMAPVSGLPRSATATALDEGRLLRIGSDDFMSLLSTEPEISLALLRTLARRLRGALQRQHR